MQNITLIIKYLNKDLDNKQIDSFEQRLKNDDAFAEEFSQISSIWEQARNYLKEQVDNPSSRDELIAAIMASHDLSQYDKSNPSDAEKALKKTISKIYTQKDAKNHKSEKGKIIQLRAGRAIITAITAAATIAFVLVISNFRKDASELAAVFYEPENDNYLREHTVITRSEQSEGITAFHQENFEVAEEAFKQDTALWITNPWMKIYYAISSYENGKHEKAIGALEKMTTHIDPNISSTSKWYLILYYIKQEKYSDAKPFLQKLKEGNSHYSKDAGRLLRVWP
ncbi:MAG TPA: hypothetical protein VJ951_07105 [Bacteroidales bacterium]|nr:hypothetical protein [Bacteroidales bacterium]